MQQLLGLRHSNGEPLVVLYCCEAARELLGGWGKAVQREGQQQQQQQRVGQEQQHQEEQREAQEKQRGEGWGQKEHQSEIQQQQDETQQQQGEAQQWQRGQGQGQKEKQQEQDQTQHHEMQQQHVHQQREHNICRQHQARCQQQQLQDDDDGGGLVTEALLSRWREVQGPVITFNLLRPDGSYVGYKEVETLAGVYGISLRTGERGRPGCKQKKGQLIRERMRMGLLTVTVVLGFIAIIHVSASPACMAAR